MQMLTQKTKKTSHGRTTSEQLPCNFRAHAHTLGKCGRALPYVRMDKLDSALRSPANRILDNLEACETKRQQCGDSDDCFVQLPELHQKIKHLKKVGMVIQARSLSAGLACANNMEKRVGINTHTHTRKSKTCGPEIQDSPPGPQDGSQHCA